MEITLFKTILATMFVAQISSVTLVTAIFMVGFVTVSYLSSKGALSLYSAFSY
jgi:hypothetical protein